MANQNSADICSNRSPGSKGIETVAQILVRFGMLFKP